MRHNPLLRSDNRETSTLDRRSSERVPASDAITLSLRGARESITGQLRDLSGEGFRAVHTGLVMCSGDYVTFHFGQRRGTAQVVWTRAAADGRESGFLIIQMTDAVS
jgi:hypothetical protein